MLQKLTIKNLAIVKNMEIEFSKELNILTGETGSGKSIIVNAIDLLMGAKFSRESFRDESEIEIIGSFNFNNEDLKIKRIFNYSGNNKTFLNDKVVTNQELKKRTKYYIDMHGQYNQHSIFDKSTHIEYLDSFGDYSDLLEEFHVLFLENEKNKQKLGDFQSFSNTKKELYEYQLSELNEIELYENIDNDLSQKYDRISNVEEIKSSIDKILYLADKQESSFKDNVVKIIKILNKLQSADSSFKRFVGLFENMKVEIDEGLYDLDLKKNEYFFDKEKFEKISSDLEKIQMIKRKYGGTICSAISYKEKIENYLNDAVDISEKINKLKAIINSDELKLLKLSDSLSEKRLNSIVLFEKKINKILKCLNMEDAVFNINISKLEKMCDKGFDSCEFYIRTNKGTKIKPVVKIASGGEVSRIMLALKILMQNKIKKNTLIFDEIDLGISGKAAENLGSTIKELSRKTQVICISHLPQIASKGKCHYKVFKITKENNTFSDVTRLDSKARVNEIAQMLSGENITRNSRLQAKYLLGI